MTLLWPGFWRLHHPERCLAFPGAGWPEPRTNRCYVDLHNVEAVAVATVLVRAALRPGASQSMVWPGPAQTDSNRFHVKNSRSCPTLKPCATRYRLWLSQCLAMSRNAWCCKQQKHCKTTENRVHFSQG